MKRTLRSSMIIALCILFFIGFLCGVGTAFGFRITASAAGAEEKIGCHATIDDNFEDNKILVTLRSEYSRFGRVSSKIEEKMFELGAIKVNNLTEFPETYVKENGTLNPETAPVLTEYYKSTPFKQILSVTLSKSDKQNVLDTIKKMETLKEVFSACPNMFEKSSYVPNDALYSNQWALNSTYGIQTQEAWNISMGSHDVRVGVIDTGIANHSDLNANVIQGKDFHNNNLTTNDDESGHGTHVAGIIGAVSNSEGVCGVAPNTTLVPLQTSYWDEEKTDWYHSSEARAKAIQYAIGMWENPTTRISILNHSIGGYGANTYFLSDIKNFPGLFVWSAGNEDADIDSRVSVYGSFDLPNLISVGAINSNGERPTVSHWGYDNNGKPRGSNYSSSGKNVNIYAPGDKIYSTVPNNKYIMMFGTSMAAPHVAGVAALLLAKDPTLTGAELKKIILNSADDITIDVPVIGEQRVKKLNAYKAMDYLINKDVNFSFADGLGSKDNPYQITTEQQFKNINAAYREVYVPGQGNDKRIDYSFKLMNDIVITDYWTPFEYKFTGSFDGDGHSITYQTKISSGSISQEYIGLFGFIATGGEVKNLTLANCRITLGDEKTELASSKYLSVGILAGSIYGGTVKNVTVKNSSIFCNTTQSFVGGIAGSTNYSNLYSCVVTGGDFSTYNGNIGGMSGSGAIYNFHGGSCHATVTKYNYVEGDRIGKIVGNLGDDCGSGDDKVTDNGITINKIAKDSGKCIAEGTLITLADGRQVPVESLTGNESLLVWNLYTGTFDTAPILFIDKDASATYKVINLAFSDGTELKVISEHGLWDYNLNRYVYLDEDAAQYIGHWFNKQTTEGGVMTSTRVRLTGVTVSMEETVAYSPVTYGHLCYYVNGMLSMPGGIDGLFNIFEVDAETMRYDAAAMERDIAQYGLFTYEEFTQIVSVPQEVYDAFNAQYFKVAIGKGIVTEERLKELAERYARQLGID